MSFWWQVFYWMYGLTSLRFFLHNGVLAFPLGKRRPEMEELGNGDLVLIQYPVRNEPVEILARFFKSLESIPEEERWRFTVQILDDYDQPLTWRPRNSPVAAYYIRRRNKTGGKAGNLNCGLRHAHRKFRWVMVYDSDHVADGSNILNQVRKMKADPKLCCVQSRWVIRNPFGGALSWLQEQFTHLHIDREQVFKSNMNLWPIFNGAGAIWRRETIEDECGGWMERTVSEDIDLSGHLQFRGYRIQVDPEWTTLIDAVDNWSEYRKQQRRWAKGNGQRLRYHLQDPKGWGLRKLYWVSWNAGLAIAITKYVTPIIMILKALDFLPFFWFDWFGLIPHAFVMIASMQTHRNILAPRYAILYPLHYLTEFRILHTQIWAFWDGFLNYRKEFEFEVTEKKV